MKACEEWLKTNTGRLDCLRTNRPCRQDNKCEKCDKEVGWRAALEWFMKVMNEIEEHDMPIKGQEVLENELGIEKNERV